MKREYLELTHLIERMHRRFLDVLRSELKRMGVEDINAVQALLLSNIGDKEIVIRDLMERGYYQGSNVSYNIKKLVEYGYLDQQRAEHDKRSVRVKLTEKALGVVAKIAEMEESSANSLAENGLSPDLITQTIDTLRKVERSWSDHINYGAN